MTPNNGNTQSNYSSVPCDSCKRRHVKCIKQMNSEICNYCFRREVDCTYLIVRNKRGPKTKVESTLKKLETIDPSNDNKNQHNGLDLRNSDIGGSVELDKIAQFYQVQLNHQYQQHQSQLFQVNNLNPMKLEPLNQQVVYPYNPTQYNRLLPATNYTLVNSTLINYDISRNFNQYISFSTT